VADGDKNAVNWQEPGYDEPPRDSAGANHLSTDYNGPDRVVTGFKDRRQKNV
jgi:hypothetical protein